MRTRPPLLAWLTGFPRLLGPTHPCPNAVDMEPFSTSALKRSITLEYLLLPPRSALKAAPPLISHWLLRNPHATLLLVTPYQSPRPSFKGGKGVRLGCDGGVSVVCLSAIHFRGRSIRQVSCYTLLGECRLPWPPSCCLDESTPFVVSSKHTFRHLNSCVWFIPHRHSCLPGLAH